jgi:hypothetical protein
MPQVQFSALLEDCDLTSLAASFYNSFADLARLNSVCAPHSSTWLEMPPSKGLGLHLNPPQARAIFKLRLGLQLFDKSMFCDKCDLKLLDPHGHHALTCKCMGSRHNRVADVLFDFLRLGQFRPSKEMGACANDLERPADILVPGLAQNGSQDLAVDVTVVSALSQSALVESALTLDGSGAVHLAELKKHEENDAKCLRLGWECLAFAMDTHGRFGDESAPFLRTLASRVGAQSGVSFASALRSIRGKLGVTLMRANGDAIIAARPLPSIDGKLIGPVDIHRMGSVADVQWEPRILPCSLSSLVAVSPLLPAVPRSDSVSPGRGAAQARLPSHGAPSLSLSLYPPRAVERECVLPVSVPACTPISVFSPFVPAAAAAAAAAVLGSGPLFPMSSEGAEFAGCASGTS